MKPGSIAPKNLASLAWFTKSTLKYTPAIAELMVIVCLLRLLGLVQPFVFQTIIDRVLPFQRQALLVGTAQFYSMFGHKSFYR